MFESESRGAMPLYSPRLRIETPAGRTALGDVTNVISPLSAQLKPKVCSRFAPPAVRVSIRGFEPFGSGGHAVHYRLRVESGARGSSWLVRRRYRAFEALDAGLRATATPPPMALPEKHIRPTAPLLAARAAGLEAYSNALLRGAHYLAAPAVVEFFELDRVWTEPRARSVDQEIAARLHTAACVLQTAARS